ncbi:MAG: bifunctional folylpolyglutamate synthase/dihydrofolate synthase [Patescibacteria group bacterium]|nr:bifunctional folylpolyglutamate synthase/dihydrofolate synthase [Patescibacteria group bacterium]
MKYQDLDQYVEYLRKFPRFGSEEYLRLHRINALLAELGHPERQLKGFQVAGTNGKGSTVAFLDSVLRQAGFRVGAFYSPHLVSYTERFRLNGRPISQTRMAQLVSAIKPAVDRVTEQLHDQPTWFEVLTAAAAVYFAREKVDWVVFEVGLGGRLDATTALGLKYKVITEIGMDHAHILGRSIKRIAKEKAGIIKPGDIVITTNSGKALKVIQSRSQKTRARLLEMPKISLEQLEIGKTLFTIKSTKKELSVEIALVGARQAINAAAVFEILRRVLRLPAKTVLAGLKRTRLEGRFEVIRKKPLTILDGAHNLPAISHLLKTLKELGYSKERLITVFGVKERKNYWPMVKLLGRRSKMIIFPKLAIPNMVSAQELKRIYPAGRVKSSLPKALAFAKTISGKNDMILITGSFYLAGEVLRLLRPKTSKRVDRMDDNQLEQKT